MGSSRDHAVGSELFIVDNSDADWKVRRYLHDWCELSKSIDIATGFFEIGALLALDPAWQKVDEIRILMGDEVSKRTKQAFAEAVEGIQQRLNDSIEAEKARNDFLVGVPAIVEALRSGKIRCRVYRKNKFHAKTYIKHSALNLNRGFQDVPDWHEVLIHDRSERLFEVARGIWPHPGKKSV